MEAPTFEMAGMAGMEAANRRCAKLGIEAVDMTWCDHGHGAEAKVQDGRVTRKLTVHGHPTPVAAIDAMCDLLEAHRRKYGRRR